MITIPRKPRSCLRLIVALIFLQSLFFFLSSFHLHHGDQNPKSSYLDHRAAGSFSEPSRNTTKHTKPRGVFVLKVQDAHHALKTLCILDVFFNQRAQYPIRIFTDKPVTRQTLIDLKRINENVDIKVFVDTQERYKDLPPELTGQERDDIAANCTLPACTTAQAPMAYVHMGYWRYRRMAFEPSLQEFDYFISWDVDAFLTKPLEFDPFQVMQENDLVGFFQTESSSFAYDEGIVQNSETVFGKPTFGQNGYLDSPKAYRIFDRYGHFTHRSIYGFVFGGRLDFFRTRKFLEFGYRMVPYTYRYRVDEQVIISTAWSMLAPNRVWHFPSHKYPLGVYHHSLLDDTQIVPCHTDPPPADAMVYNASQIFCYWVNPIIFGTKRPLQFRYQGFYWLHWVDYEQLVPSILARSPLNTTRLLQPSFRECLCLSGKDQKKGRRKKCMEKPVVTSNETVKLPSSTKFPNSTRYPPSSQESTSTVHTTSLSPPKPRGVFVYKVNYAHEALRSICILDKFFNHGPAYPIRIFTDEIETHNNDTLQALYNINPQVDLQVIVDPNQRWKDLPTELNDEDRKLIALNCTVDSCTTRREPLGYVYMGYWRYRLMALEPSLQDFDYFISIDTDAYLTKPLGDIVDPFEVMHRHNLSGITVNDCQNYGFDQGVAATARQVFGPPNSSTGYLDSKESFPLFDDQGDFNDRSFYGYMFGGRLDVFRHSAFREFGRRMVPYTYRYRVDEQVIVAMAWSMLLSDKVWHLPSHGFSIGVYHNSLVDDFRLVDCTTGPSPPSEAAIYNQSGLCYWINPLSPGKVPSKYIYNGNFHKNQVDYMSYVQHTGLHEAPRQLKEDFEHCLCQPGKTLQHYHTHHWCPKAKRIRLPKV